MKQSELEDMISDFEERLDVLEGKINDIELFLDKIYDKLFKDGDEDEQT
jgi:hypothetical protein